VVPSRAAESSKVRRFVGLSQVITESVAILHEQFKVCVLTWK